MSFTQPLQFSVPGMRCGACVGRVERALAAVPGVSQVSVNLATERAALVAQPNVTGSAIDQALSQAGYQAARHTYLLPIEGMHCASCVGRIEKALLSHPAVISASVNLASERATVTVIQDAISLEELVRLIAQAGYQARIDSGDNTDSQSQSSASGRAALTEGQQLLLAALLSLPLMLPMLLWPLGIHWMLPGWVQLLLATPVQFYVGLYFYRGAWSALKAKTGNMDLLVAIGTSAAFGLSLFELLRPLAGGAAGHVYFEAAAVVITLVRLGKWLERRAKSQTSAAIQSLQALRPDTVRIMRNGQTQVRPLAEVQVGDQVRVLPGEQIPVDATILQGSSHIDEAMVTGESVPISKHRGDRVIGGTLNGEGMLELETTAVGRDTVLANIIAMVESAQAAKAGIQRLVDRVSAVFVPAVIVAALVTLLIWLALGAAPETAILNAVAVLVIACPCALGLATPAAIMVGTGVAARQGILIRDAQTLEMAQRITTVVFDKTGTLTQGLPRLQDTLALAGSEQQVLALAASLQASSSHPLAIATVNAATQQALECATVSDAATLPGRGLQGRVKDQQLLLGNRQLMKDFHIDLTQLEAPAAALEAEGKTLSFLARLDGTHQPLAMFSYGDTLRAGAQETIARLNAQGIQSVMITGDNEGSAKRVAEQLGIKHFRANVLPQQKVDAVNELRKPGERVAMVGDGINDAPALATADIGIAMASGSDVAMHSAGITLMSSELGRVADALEIARRCYAKIRQNLFWAFVYNIIGIPLAAAGMLNPVLAATAMALSSICVIGNALLLRRWRPKGAPTA